MPFDWESPWVGTVVVVFCLALATGTVAVTLGVFADPQLAPETRRAVVSCGFVAWAALSVVTLFVRHSS